MTQYLYNIKRNIETLEAIEEHSGKNVTQIAKDIDWQPIIARINEMMDNGLAGKMGSVYDGKKHVYLTRKGKEVLEMLRQVQARIESEDGEYELADGESLVKMSWLYKSPHTSKRLVWKEERE